MFMPSGLRVLSSYIQKASLFRRRFKDESCNPVIFSIPWTDMSERECPSELKCLATGLSSLFLMSYRWPLILVRSLFLVIPTYWIPHFLHVTRYIRLSVLHDILLLMWYSFPVTELLKVLEGTAWLQVSHPLCPHLKKPGPAPKNAGSGRLVASAGANFVETRMSLRLFGRR